MALSTKNREKEARIEIVSIGEGSHFFESFIRYNKVGENFGMRMSEISGMSNKSGKDGMSRKPSDNSSSNNKAYDYEMLTDKPVMYWEQFTDEVINIVYNENKSFLPFEDRKVTPNEIIKVYRDGEDVEIASFLSDENSAVFLGGNSSPERFEAMKNTLLSLFKNFSVAQKEEVFAILVKAVKRGILKNDKYIDFDLNTLETYGGSLISAFTTIEEMNDKARIIHPILPEEVFRTVMLASFDVKNASGTEKKNLTRITKYLVNDIDWVFEHQDYDVDEIRDILDINHIGSEYAKDKLVKEVEAYNCSRNKKPGKPLLINGSAGSGKTTLAIAYALAMGIPYAIIDAASIGDPVEITGSSRNYENGNISSVFRKILGVGLNGMLIIEHIDKISKDECISPIADLINRRFTDAFLETSIDLSNLWIVATSNNTRDVSKSILDASNVVNINAYSYEEKMCIVKEFIIPYYCNEYSVAPSNIKITDEVIERVIKEFSRSNSISDIAENICEIFKNYIHLNRKKIKVTNRNLGEYLPMLSIRETLKKEYVTEISALREKYVACRAYYNEDISERIENLLDMAYKAGGGNEADVDYAIRALTKLVNTSIEECPDIEINEVISILNESHFGLEKPKNEVLKVIIGNKYRKTGRYKSILLEGPAGIGKTTIAKSVAKALKVPYVKVSLNGISSSDILSGYGKSYKDADAGLIMRALSKPEVASYTCVMLLDEIDKMAASAEGDPYAALHNLLDNADGFYDKYLDVTIPTDRIFFICTSNDKSKIPATILDRLEVIDLGGYTANEKNTITENYVIPKTVEIYGLQENIIFPSEVIDYINSEYCTSFGVRDVERTIENIVQQVIKDNPNIEKKRVEVTKEMVGKYLGARPLSSDCFPDAEHHVCGEARALAVAGNHGSTFSIQVVDNPFSDEKLKITGLTTNSTTESIYVAMTVVSKIMGQKIPNIHVHFGDSGVKKDGPSAGITMAAALMSFMTKEALPNVAFTGELDVNANVFPIGGELLKLAAAEKAGVEKVFIPYENYRVLSENGDLGKFKLEVVPVKTFYDIIDELFGDSMKRVS